MVVDVVVDVVVLERLSLLVNSFVGSIFTWVDGLWRKNPGKEYYGGRGRTRNAKRVKLNPRLEVITYSQSRSVA